MFLERFFDFKNPDMGLLKASLAAFALVFVPLIVFEQVFGNYSIFSQFWLLIGVAFHEIGHLAFMFILAPILNSFPGLPAFWAKPLTYLGSFLFNAIAGIVLLFFSLFLQSKLTSRQLDKKNTLGAFSFLLIAYFNILMVPYTLTHLQHVIGPGLDFTVASFYLSLRPSELVALLWNVAWITIAAVLLLNLLFVFRRRPLGKR